MTYLKVNLFIVYQNHFSFDFNLLYHNLKNFLVCPICTWNTIGSYLHSIFIGLFTINAIIFIMEILYCMFIRFESIKFLDGIFD